MKSAIARENKRFVAKFTRNYILTKSVIEKKKSSLCYYCSNILLIFKSFYSNTFDRRTKIFHRFLYIVHITIKVTIKITVINAKVEVSSPFQVYSLRCTLDRSRIFNVSLLKNSLQFHRVHLRYSTSQK